MFYHAHSSSLVTHCPHFCPARHQFSHVANFWKQGRQASFRLEALPEGHAELNITFQLPQASEVIPPQRPISPLFFNGWAPKRSCGADSQSQAPPKKVSSRLRKNYRRSVFHRAALAVPSLPLQKMAHYNRLLKPVSSASRLFQPLQ